MKKKALIGLATVIISVSGIIYGFTNKTETAIASALETRSIDNCPLAGSPDCPLIQNCPDKGTTDCQYTTANCCVNK